MATKSADQITEVVLGTSGLTFEEVIAVARFGAKVSISADSVTAINSSVIDQLLLYSFLTSFLF